MLLLEFHEQTINHFLIPSFTLSKGEIVIIRFPDQLPSRDVELALANIFAGKVTNNHVSIVSPLAWVEPLKESWFRYHFWPITVGAYLHKYANRTNAIAGKIYDIEWMHPKIKIRTLAGNPRKQLALYKTLSWTNNIVFDLAGVDPQGCQDIFNFVKNVVQSGGAAILFDRRNEFKEECNRFIEVTHLG